MKLILYSSVLIAFFIFTGPYSLKAGKDVHLAWEIIEHGHWENKCSECGVVTSFLCRLTLRSFYCHCGNPETCPSAKEPKACTKTTVPCQCASKRVPDQKNIYSLNRE